MVQAIKRDEVFIEPEGIHIETHQPERRSRKPPLLLIHGVLTGSWLWNEFAVYLAERGWEAHAMNLRGHFTSDVADLAETTMRDYADDVGELVEPGRSDEDGGPCVAGRHALPGLGLVPSVGEALPAGEIVSRDPEPILQHSYMKRREVQSASRTAHPFAPQPVGQAVRVADEQVALPARQQQAEGGRGGGASLLEGSCQRVRRQRDRREQVVVAGGQYPKRVEIGIEEDAVRGQDLEFV